VSERALCCPGCGVALPAPAAAVTAPPVEAPLVDAPLVPAPLVPARPVPARPVPARPRAAPPVAAPRVEAPPVPVPASALTGGNPGWTAATPVAIGEGAYAPPPAPHPGSARFVAPTRDQLHPIVRRARRRTKVRVVAYTLLVGVLAAAGLIGYNSIRRSNDAVPTPIAFVKGAGIIYAPTGQGYRIRLPEKPTRVTPHTTTNRKLVVHESELTYRHFEITVTSYNLPAGTVKTQADFDMRSLLQIWAGTAAKVMKITPTLDHGRPALEVLAAVPAAHPSRVHVVFGSRHVVLIAVNADDGSTGVYNAIVSSLRLS